ncbi:NUDIX hydrolase [Halocatena marina]|uniref:NUDIX hydrolase n=1 Tax=Halocatena marina TaxID=2934937 RepID=A0ABD5YSI6_9EURY|nr:NUDIX domain-containing protein [Halocatena marina]
MTYKEINREEIERRRDRLLDHFGETPIRERHDTPSADRFEEWIEMSNAGYIGSAYALVRRSPDQQTELTESMAVEGDERERVLLILGRGSSDWGVPGGGQENDETLESTVHREVAEEVAIDISLLGLNHLRHEIATCEGYNERLHVLRAFFQAEYVGGSISVQPGELNGAAWFVNPPIDDRLLPSTQRLLDGWNRSNRSDFATARY